MSKLMEQKDVKNHVHRNGFDLTFRNLFTAKVGELLPVFCKEVLPGDRWHLGLNLKSRTAPVQTAAFTRIREYFDFYFVPTSLLWDKFNNYIVQTNNYNHAQSISASPDKFAGHPYFTLSDLVFYYGQIKSSSSSIFNAGGMHAFQSTMKLLKYLGYGDLSKATSSSPNLAFNPFPLMAYQKIYYDYYRFSQWETNKPQNYNCDYVFKNTDLKLKVSQLQSLSTPSGSKLQDDMFTLRYANYKKDLIMGVLRSPQFGDTAIACPLTGGTQRMTFTDVNASGGNMSNGFLADVRPVVSDSVYPPGTGVGVSVFALRLAEATQKWREITNSGSLDFKEQIQKHWNVRVSDAESYRCKWLGGHASNISINPVVNNNISTEDSQALIAGLGEGGSSNRNIIDYEAKEYGYIIGIYHAEPILDYHNNGISRLFLKTDAESYAIPEYDSLGMVSLPLSELSYSSSSAAEYFDKSMGYVPRYYDYKTSRDLVNGAFETSLQDWVAPINEQALYDEISKYGMSYFNFKIKPWSLDSIFSPQASVDDSVDSDQIYTSVLFDVSAVRNLSFSGLPY